MTVNVAPPVIREDVERTTTLLQKSSSDAAKRHVTEPIGTYYVDSMV